MNTEWKQIVISDIKLAMYVLQGTGKSVHENRPMHGFVLNDAHSAKDYIFSDGYVLHTEENHLYYLPKGSSYHVKTVREGDCYAINFDAEIEDAPFSVKLRDNSSLLHNFRAAATAWKNGKPFARAAAMRAIYDAVYQIEKHHERQYLPNDQRARLAPALEAIERNGFDQMLTVREMAALSSMSEVYFRRLFLQAFGISPKEYMIKKRIEYAKTLLLSGQFSVLQTARLSGYAEACHFSREFKRHVGVPPEDFRSQSVL